MQYAGIIKDDLAAAPGISVSFFTQGCPHRCKGCHNPETWSFTGGKEFTHETLKEIMDALTAHGVKRNLCVMGGEPLCDENTLLTYLVIKEVKEKLPDTKVYIWSGYTYEELIDRSRPRVKEILKLADVLIDGPYVEEERDITLKMRGSRNQRVIDLTEKL